MLQLLGTPQWVAPPQAPRLLPATVPGCLLVYLAARGDWHAREQLCDFCWPGEPPAQAQRKLRVTLHRVQGLLHDWGRPEALQRDRTRVRLSLPTDVQALATVAGAGPAAFAALVALDPDAWLQGFRVPGQAAFDDWADRQGRRCRHDWAVAAERALAAADESAPSSPPPGILVQPLPAQAGALRHQLQQRLQVLLATSEPGGGAAWSAPRPPVTTAPRPGLGTATLPGRHDELAWLRRSTARAVLLLGEPGVGKSALLQAAAPSAPALAAREGQAGVPFAPLLEWLRHHTAALCPALRDPSHPLHPYRLDLARLLPDWAVDEALPPLDALTAKSRLLEALARAVEHAGPLLRVDDLQWCDGATLEWLAFCVHRGGPRWWASARSSELPEAIRHWLSALQPGGQLQTLPVPPLSPAAVAEACRSRWPLRAWSGELLAALAQASAGNPFVLGELLAMGADRAWQPGARLIAPRRVRELVQRHLAQVGPAARAALDAAAVLARPVPAALLLDVADPADPAHFARGCDEALQADLLRADAQGLQCRHDLIRQTVEAALGPTQRAWLHRRAALALAARGGAQPLDIAAHWQAAAEPQTALAWLHRGAQQLHEQGDFERARGLWQQVATQSLDVAQALRARLALAEGALLLDLAQGRQALLAVLADSAAVAEPAVRDELEAQALAGLVDNAVFSGDLARAAELAVPLRERLPRLRPELRPHALEVLIELAMRQPDAASAWACLAQLRQLAPGRPALLSYEGQIHWFTGDVRAARDAFERLLARHADYCRGLTIENDLAVMLHALGDLARAEQMARRSLQHWRGVAHTEALSSLVLGSVLTSQGRTDEADTVLQQALRLAREQASPGFEAEALVRLARLALHQGLVAAADARLAAAAPLLAHSSEPLRVSQLIWVAVLARRVQGEAPDAAQVARLQAVVQRSQHPLVHARWWRVCAEQAWAQGQHRNARQALARALRLARQHGLHEPLLPAERALTPLAWGPSQPPKTVSTPV